MTVFYRSFLTLLMLVWLPLVQAQSSDITIDDRFSLLSLANNIEYQVIVDNGQSLPPGDDNQWLLNPYQTINFGAQDQHYWFRFKLNNITEQRQSLILALQNPQINTLQMWLKDNDGQWHESQKIGDFWPFHQRPIEHEQLLLPIELAVGQQQVVYLKVGHNGLFNLPMTLWKTQQFIEASSQSTLYGALLLGFLAATIFSSLLLFLVSSNQKFILFCLTLIAQSLTLATLYGFANRYIWPDWPWLQQHILPVLIGGSLMLSTLFGIALLNIRQHQLKLLQLARGFVALGGLIVVLSLLLPVYIATMILLIYAMLVSLAMLFIGVWSWRNQLVSAKWFTVAWVITCLTFLSLLLGVVFHRPAPINSLTLVTINVVVSAILLFIALTRQYINQKTAQVVEQQRAMSEIKNHDEMQQQLLTVEAQLREELEVKFQERNFELEVTLRELEETNRELEQKNTQDALTGIRNRRFFDKKYLGEFRRSRREQTQLSLVMLDIDHFKQVNDNYGHLAGDDVIRYVGRTISDILKRPSDEACRYGGEEFALILPNTTDEGAIQVAEAIRQKLADNSIDTQAGPLKITISCGICCQIANNQMSQNHYIELADKALYHAKQTGRNKVVHQRDCQ